MDELRLIPLEDDDAPTMGGLRLVPIEEESERTWTRAIAETIAPLISSKSNAVDALEGSLLQQQGELVSSGRAAVDGFSAGFADELLGSVDGQAREDWRTSSKEFAKDSPVLSTTANILGGILSPVSKVAAIAKIPGIAGVASALPGYLRTGLNLGAQAGIQAFGEGEGGASNRIGSSVVNAPIAAALGTGGEKLIDMGAARIGEYDPIIRKIAELTGYDAPSKQLIQEASSRMEDAGKLGVEGYAVLDALQPAYIKGRPTSKSSLGAYARGATKGSMGDGGMADAHTLIYSRLPSNLQATESVLDSVAKGIDPEDAILSVSKRAEEVVQGLTAARAEATAPLYKAALEEAPTLSVRSFDELTSIPAIKQELAAVRADRAVDGVSIGESDVDWSTDTWIKVRSRVSDDLRDIKSSAPYPGKSKDEASTARLLRKLDDTLNQETKGKFGVATKAFAEFSKSNPEVFEKTGIVNQLARQSEERFGPMKKVWGDSAISMKNIDRAETLLGNEANRQGFRAVSSEMLPDRISANAAGRLLQSDRWNQQSKAILGELEAEQLGKHLNYLHTIHDNNAYLTGNSSTASELMSSAQDSVANLKPKLNPLNWLAEAIGESRGRASRDTRNTMMSTLLKGGDEGRDILKEVASYMDDAGLYRDRVEPVRQVGLSVGRNISPTDILSAIRGR
jgi:hypothetical protein